MEREFISSFESQWDGADIVTFEVLRYKNGEELEIENMNKGQDRKAWLVFLTDWRVENKVENLGWGHVREGLKSFD